MTWELREDGLDLGRLAEQESLLTLVQRARRRARVARRGRAGRPQRHLPVRLPRDPAAALRRVRLRQPGGGGGRRRRPRRDARAAAGRRRALRRPLRRAARPRARARHARRARSPAPSHWRSPAGREVKVRSTRLVSFTQRAILAIEYEVEAVGDDMRVVLQSELSAEPDITHMQSDDPRAAAQLEDPLVGRGALTPTRRWSCSSTAPGAPGCGSPPRWTTSAEGEADVSEDVGRLIVAADLPAGETLRLVKYVAYAWSGQRSASSLRAQVRGSLAEARHSGWQGLLDQQRAYLDDFWARADVEVDGDDELQLAVRYGLFGVLQACARAERRAIGAKGLTGTGYDGHAFWDTEAYVLPVLTYTLPEAAADALRWRVSTLDEARERARQLTLAGAAFPWRTIAGRECSGYWPAGTAAFHVNAAIAGAAVRLWRATRRREAARRGRPPDRHGDGAAVDGARPPRRGGRLPHPGRHRSRRVLGAGRRQRLHEPDGGGQPARGGRAGLRGRRRARGLGDRGGRDGRPVLARRRRPRPGGGLPRPRRLGLRARRRPSEYPLLLHFPYFDLYRKQVIKQADLVMALWTCGDRFTDDGEGARVRLLRAADRARLVPERVRPGDRRRRDRATSSSPTTTSARPRWSTSTTSTTTPTTGSTARRWPAPGWRSWPASAGSATTTA